MPVSNLSTGNSYGSGKKPQDAGGTAQFPAGLRVLVVDDDHSCLKILEQMLRRCMYHPTTCSKAEDALSLLRDRKGCFDVVISDVHMPDMDGFKLLELVGLEMDLPVIMMSADGSTQAVMNGIKHGACDYLIKPVRLEELKNIWQHVIRKKFHENKELEQSGSLEDSDRNRRGVEDTEYTSSVNEGADSTWKAQKKKREAKEDEDDGELENDDPSSTKKQRVVWSVELHQQFVSAVNQLGIEKAVPKRILELMNIPGLTRENVASHLQKYRLYLKRLNGGQHLGGMPHPFCSSIETNSKVAQLGRIDFQALAASGQMPPQTLAAFHAAEFMGRHSGSIALPALDQPNVPQASIQGPKCLPGEHRVAFGQTLVKCQSNISKQFPQPAMAIEDISSSGFGSWPSSHVSAAYPSNNLGGLNDLQNGNLLVQMLQQQQPQPILTEPNHGINVQPSCLVIPTQSPSSFQVGNNNVPMNQNSLVVPVQSSYGVQATNSPFTINQNSSFSNCSTVGDYVPFSSQSNNISLGTRQLSDGEYKNVGVLNGYSIPGPISSSSSSCSLRNESATVWKGQHSAMNLSSGGGSSAMPNLCDIQGSGMSIGVKHDHRGQGKSYGFVGKGTSIPSRFAVDDIEYPTDDLYQRKTYIGDDASRVKQEIHLDFVEGSKVGNPGLPQFSGDFMSVLSK